MMSAPHISVIIIYLHLETCRTEVQGYFLRSRPLHLSMMSDLLRGSKAPRNINEELEKLALFALSGFDFGFLP
ncbi:hypothetical protein BDV35DRAFT_218005 [Aspergillus flavus]|uniref:Uncharacterized protein n=1 Tax=Aspergillus flavus TaxID=5059 RepID=A0A5N6GXL9_ASPFL|nr:hypothetical protein BDV35DRAFT_218005 [Aspergillus flavus]